MRNQKLTIILTIAMIIIVGSVLYYFLNIQKQQATNRQNLPTDNSNKGVDKYRSDNLYCEKDSDCTTQPTKTSKCCGNACPDIVNIYNYDDSEIDCGKTGCSDLYFVCPPFEVKCINNQCQKINKTKSATQKDSRCIWEPGSCDSIVRPGYYYNSSSKECVFYDDIGCVDPPFGDINECDDICSGF